jgi:hypothetical protein
MTWAQLLALMATMQCHSMVVDIPERHETVVQTVCVKVIPLKEETKPVAKAKPQKKKRAVVKCKRKWYTKNGHRYWRCKR